MRLHSRQSSAIVGIASVFVAAMVSLGCPPGEKAVAPTDETVLRDIDPTAEWDSTFIGDTLRTRSLTVIDIKSTEITTNFAWVSSNPAVVKIVGSNLTTTKGSQCCITLVPVSEGSAVVTATMTDNVKTASGQALTYKANVSVAGLPTSLKISPSSAPGLQVTDAGRTNPGSRIDPKAIIRSASGRPMTSNLEIRWSIIGGDAAKLTFAGGLLTSSLSQPLGAAFAPTVFGVAAGTARLVASLEPRTGRSYPVLADTILLTVGGGQVLVTSATPTNTTMEAGDTQQFTAQVKDLAGATITPPIAWSSSRVAIATVDANGKVTAIGAAAEGDTVSVLANVPLLGITGKQTFTVLRRVASATIAPNPASVATGGFRVVVARFKDAAGGSVIARKSNPQWDVTSGTDIVAIFDQTDSTAVLQGLKTGDAVVRVRYGSVSATVPVRVTPPAASTIILAIQTGSATRAIIPAGEPLLVGATLAVVATAKDLTGVVVSEPLTYSATPSGLVTITSTGQATANIVGVAPGTATITVTSSSDLSVKATATVIVSPVSTGGPAVRIVLTSTPLSGITTVGGTVQFTGVPKDANGNTASDCATIQWATDQSAVGGVNAAGLATGVGIGTTAVRAFCADRGSISVAGRLTVVDGVFGVSRINITPRYFYVPASTLTQFAQFSATPVQSASGGLSPIEWLLDQSPLGVGTIDATGKVSIPPATVAGYAGGVRVIARSAGQSDTSWVTYGNAGSIKGTVLSTSGAYLGGTTARVVPTAGGAQAIFGLNNEGIFYAVGLAPGSYTVDVRQQGNPTAQLFTNVIVTAGGTTLLTLVPFP